MTRYAVRAANIPITEPIELVDANNPAQAIKLAQVKVKKTFLRPAAIDADSLRAHIQNKELDHHSGSWYDCVKCGQLPQGKHVPSNYESVDLLASGYEWRCPAEFCNHLNHEDAVKEWVNCAECGRGYATNPPDHALE